VRFLHKTRKSARLGVSATLLVAALAAAACGSGGSSSGTSGGTSAAPHQGGSLTVLEGSGFSGAWPAGLDPATNTNGAADQSYMDSIFGQLFELGSHS
jgi:peptide/nickel transport system substrate-binding protein